MSFDLVHASLVPPVRRGVGVRGFGILGRTLVVGLSLVIN